MLWACRCFPPPRGDTALAPPDLVPPTPGSQETSGQALHHIHSLQAEGSIQG